VKIVDLIQREGIVPALSAKSKPAIIRELAVCMSTRYDFIDEAALVKVLSDREALASTAIGEGVAIPHGKLATVPDIVTCLGRAVAGVDFDSMDGAPTYLFFVMIAPEACTGAHLKALARISRVFKDQAFRQRLLEAADVDAMYETIAREDAKY